MFLNNTESIMWEQNERYITEISNSVLFKERSYFPDPS